MWLCARVASALPLLYDLNDAGSVRDAALLTAGSVLADTQLSAVKAAGDDAPADSLCVVDEGDNHRVLLERLHWPASRARTYQKGASQTIGQPRKRPGAFFIPSPR